MPRESVPQMTLRYTGIFDWDGMYAAVVDWAKMYGYKWHEKAYKHKVPSPDGAEIELDWELETVATEYIKYKITFAIHAYDLSDIDIDVNGKKKRLTNARVSIIINGDLDYDWQLRFTGSPFRQKLGELYRKWTGSVDQTYMDQLYYRMWNLHAMLKKYFDMQGKKHVYKNYLGES